MSGIAGIIRFDGGPVEPELISRMTSTMRHRGPDGIRHWVKGSAGLGHCMLCTTPESLEETQPLANEDESLVLVMDGWLENWIELRKELLDSGANLRTRADAELVLRAYETWGDDCLTHIDGNFVLVIFDARRQRAFAVRDRMGLKPINYWFDGKTLAFASEVCAILALPFVPQIPNNGMIAEVIANDWMSRDETLWAGINRVIAAHSIAFSADGQNIRKYWSIPENRQLIYRDDREYVDHYRTLLFEATRRASRSAGPLAHEVSGGHDSSALFAAADLLRRKGQLLAPALKGYTLALDEGRANDLCYARAVGAHLGVSITEVPPAHRTVGWYRDRALLEKDIMSTPSGILSLGLRERMAADGCTVYIHGDAGDEVAGGRRLYYAEELLARRYGRLRETYSQDVRTFGILQASRWLIVHGLFHLLPAALKSPLRQVRNRWLPSQAAFEYLLAPEARALLQQRRTATERHVPRPEARVGLAAFIGTMTDPYNTAAVEMSERMDSRAGIESRGPFYSRHLVEFAAATPERLKLKGDINKHMHLQAVSDLLPVSVLERRQKAIFADVMWDVLPEVIQNIRGAEGNRLLDKQCLNAILRHAAQVDTSQLEGLEWAIWFLFSIHCVDNIIDPYSA